MADHLDQGSLLDQALTLAVQYNYAELKTHEAGPLKVIVDRNANSISVSNFPKREVAGLKKLFFLFDVQIDVRLDASADSVVDDYLQNQTLPESIQLRSNLMPYSYSYS